MIHSLNAKIGFEKYALGPKIMAKKSQNMNFGIFWLLSQGPINIFKKQFLHLNDKLKSVVLSTMKPINGIKFLPSSVPVRSPVPVELELVLLSQVTTITTTRRTRTLT